MLPNPHRKPPCLKKPANGVFISLPRSLELQLPPLPIGDGQLSVFRALMPEAPVEEHCDAFFAENDVGGPPQRWQWCYVNLVTEPTLVKL